MHLIIGSERALLIDTGMGAGDLKGAVEALTDKPVDVVNTHFHGDHTGGNGQFARVFCPEYDLPYLKSQMSHPEMRMRPLCDEKIWFRSVIKPKSCHSPTVIVLTRRREELEVIHTRRSYSRRLYAARPQERHPLQW